MVEGLIGVLVLAFFTLIVGIILKSWCDRISYLPGNLQRRSWPFYDPDGPIKSREEV